MNQQFWEEIEKEFDEIQFSSCPTEEKEPFFWRWTDKGKEAIKFFYRQKFDEYQKQVREMIEGIIAEEMLICHKENQPTSRLTSAMNKIYDKLTPKQ